MRGYDLGVKLHEVEMELKAQETRLDILQEKREKSKWMTAVVGILFFGSYFVGLLMLGWSIIMPDRAFGMLTVGIIFAIGAVSVYVAAKSLLLEMGIKKVGENVDEIKTRLDRIAEDVEAMEGVTGGA